MKILTLLSDGRMREDMLCDSLMYGLTRAFGSVNVYDPFTMPQYNAHPDCMKEWPVFLGATSRYGQPCYEPDEQWVASASISHGCDVHVANTRFMRYAVAEGLCSPEEHSYVVGQLRHNKLIIVNGSDNPESWIPETDLEQNARLLVERPGRVGPPPFDKPKVHVSHISVPMEHVWRMMSYPHYEYPAQSTNIYVGWNDNGPTRRAIMEALVKEFSPHNLPGDRPRNFARLRWGSVNYPIPGTDDLRAPPRYYEETRGSDLCVSARGVGIDCLRTAEILALGSLLVSDDQGWNCLEDGVHYLRFSSPGECIERCRWALAHESAAAMIAAAGHQHYLEHDTPEQQCVRIITASGLLT